MHSPGLLSLLAHSGETWKVKEGQEGHTGGGSHVGQEDGGRGGGQVVEEGGLVSTVATGSHVIHSSHSLQQLSHGSGLGQAGGDGDGRGGSVKRLIVQMCSGYASFKQHVYANEEYSLKRQSQDKA